MANVTNFSEREKWVRLTANRFFQTIDKSLKGAPDYGPEEQILRRAGFIISYQALYADAYPIVVQDLGEPFGKDVGHALLWATCLQRLHAHPELEDFENDVRALKWMRARAIYEFKDFHYSWQKIEKMLSRIDRLVAALYESANATT